LRLAPAYGISASMGLWPRGEAAVCLYTLLEHIRRWRLVPHTKRPISWEFSATPCPVIPAYIGLSPTVGGNSGWQPSLARQACLPLRLNAAAQRRRFIREKLPESANARKHAAEYFQRFPKGTATRGDRELGHLQSQEIEFTLRRLREPIAKPVADYAAH